MTANYEARLRCPVPSQADCFQELARVSAEVQQRRGEENRSEEEGPEAA